MSSWRQRSLPRAPRHPARRRYLGNAVQCLGTGETRFEAASKKLKPQRSAMSVCLSVLDTQAGVPEAWKVSAVSERLSAFRCLSACVWASEWGGD